MEETVNFNKLAWNAPKHGNDYGYLPTDDMYTTIIEWLGSGRKLWKSDEINGVIKTRMSFGTEYDALVKYRTATKMISWTFIGAKEFNTL